MRILYIGPDYAGSNGTCWRDAFCELGHDVRTIDDEKYYSPRGFAGKLAQRVHRRPLRAQTDALNAAVLKQAREFKPEMTFYIKAYYVLPETVDATRRFGLNFAFMNDDMFMPGISTFTFLENIKRMDCILTTKSFSVREYHAAGSPLAIYVPNAYDPRIHYPAQPSDAERAQYEADVAFIGNFRPWKANFLSHLAKFKTEFKLNVWGPDWHNMTRVDHWIHTWKWLALRDCVRGRGLWCAEMGKAIQSTKIMLGLVLREVRDLHTSRSFQIPACGGFMLGERTEEHRMYFTEDKEAVYFSSQQELIDKVRFYLAHDNLRQRIAEAGYQKVLRLNARYVDRAAFAIGEYQKLTRARSIARRPVVQAVNAGV
jgi:spore maturation protein CgeB